MVAIRRNILRKTITYMLIGALTVTTLTSIYTQSVFAEEETIKGNSDNPYKGNPDNVFDLMKNSWIYTVTQLGFFVNDFCTFDFNSFGVGKCQNKIDYEEWLSGHNMTADDVVDSYDASTGTVNLSINYVKNVYNDVLDAVQEDEGWYWSNGKNGYPIIAKYQKDVANNLKTEYLKSKTCLILPVINVKDSNVVDVDYGNFFIFSVAPYIYIENIRNLYSYKLSSVDSEKLKKERLFAFSKSSQYDYDWFSLYGYDENLNTKSQYLKAISNKTGNYLMSSVSFNQIDRYYFRSWTYYYTYTLGNDADNSDLKYFLSQRFYGPKQKIYFDTKGIAKNSNDGNVLIQSINDNLSSISIKLDDLNRDWLKVNNEIKDLIDDYMKDFQDYTEKQDKIDAAISSTLATMNENLAAGKEDLIGAIKESAAVQQLWLERIYNKEVEIYTKYLEENEQTQAVLVGIANQLKEYFEASLKNQGNYLTYDQFAAYAQQIIDAINNSGGTSGTGTDGSAVDMSTVDEYIKKIYEKEVNLYDELQAISKKLDNINDNLTKYLWNTDKSIPFLADIANLIKDGFEKCSAPLDILSEKLDELINLAKSILAVLSLNTLIDSLDRTKSDDEEENASIFTLVKMIMYLVLILGSLVVLFLKILQYIVLMFQIPAEPALFNENILLGWNYANSICIPGTSFSIIAFLRLLMYITVIFTVVKVLRRAINNGSIGVIK